METLISDNRAGFVVELKHDFTTKKTWLSGKTENAEIEIVIPSGINPMEAFRHPCLYLPESAAFFRKKESDKSL